MGLVSWIYEIFPKVPILLTEISSSRSGNLRILIVAFAGMKIEKSSVTEKSSVKGEDGIVKQWTY